MYDTIPSAAPAPPAGNEPPPARPPARFRFLSRALNWRVPEQYRPWVARDISSPQWRWYFGARIVGWGAAGFVISWIVDEIMRDPPRHTGNYLLSPLFISVLLLVLLRGRPYEARRRKAYRWQRVTPGGQPLPPTAGGARGGNAVIVLTVVAVLAGATALNVQRAGAQNRTVCLRPSTRRDTDLAGRALASQPGFSPIPDGASGTGRFDAHDVAQSTVNPPAMNRLLACDTFVAGYTRAFTSTAEPHRGFTVKIYEFGRPAGAARYAATDLRGTLRQQPGLVDNLPIGHLITLNNADTFGNRVALVIGAVGPYVYVVRLFAHSEPDPTEVRAIAERQHRQLTQPTPSSA